MCSILLYVCVFDPRRERLALRSGFFIDNLSVTAEEETSMQHPKEHDSSLPQRSQLGPVTAIQESLRVVCTILFLQYT